MAGKDFLEVRFCELEVPKECPMHRKEVPGIGSICTYKNTCRDRKVVIYVKDDGSKSLCSNCVSTRSTCEASSVQYGNSENVIDCSDHEQKRESTTTSYASATKKPLHKPSRPEPIGFPVNTDDEPMPIEDGD